VFFTHTLSVFRFLPSLTMMHLCITQCTYWTPLHSHALSRAVVRNLFRERSTNRFLSHLRVTQVPPLNLVQWW